MKASVNERGDYGQRLAAIIARAHLRFRRSHFRDATLPQGGITLVSPIPSLQPLQLQPLRTSGDRPMINIAGGHGSGMKAWLMESQC